MIRILSDSTADLPLELIREFHITVLPLYIRLHDKEYRDGIDITTQEIFQWSDEHNTTPQTAAVSQDDAVRFFKPILEAGDQAVVFTISSEMSATWNNCMMAVKDLQAEDKIAIIDSRSLSSGIGLQVVRAAEDVQKGMSLAEIVADLKSINSKVRASFVVDTLLYLHRGGRCSSTAAFFGNALQLKPRIVVNDGVMSADKKYRGKQSKVIQEYVRDLSAQIDNAVGDWIFITHTCPDPAIPSAVYDLLAARNQFRRIIINTAGGVISSHCGPGTLGVLFIEK